MRLRFPEYFSRAIGQRLNALQLRAKGGGQDSNKALRRTHCSSTARLRFREYSPPGAISDLMYFLSIARWQLSATECIATESRREKGSSTVAYRLRPSALGASPCFLWMLSEHLMLNSASSNKVPPSAISSSHNSSSRQQAASNINRRWHL